MTKTLYLIRHAQAEDGFSKSDIDRNLTDKGKRQSEVLSALMQERGLVCDLAILSPSARTRETFQYMNLDIPHIEEETLYSGSPDDYLTALKNVEKGYDDVMIVGHNPTCSILSVQLTQEGAPADLMSIRSGFKKSQLVVIHFDIKTWDDIAPRSGFLSGIIMPDV